MVRLITDIAVLCIIMSDASGADGGFVLTDDMANVSLSEVRLADLKANALASTILSGVSLLLCSLILVLAGWIYSCPSARHALDRLSFRLMLWTMVFEVGYDLCYILLDPPVSRQKCLDMR